ncbi:MAG: hypothetical protein QW756_03255 [Nitrososphaerota archaeon]
MKPVANTIVLLAIGLLLVIVGVALSWRLLIELVGLLLLIIGVAFIVFSLGFLRR